MMDTPRSSRSLQRRDTTSQSSTSFSIADNVPFFQYSGPSSTSPWTSGYALQSDGYDETLHISSVSNSTIAFNISASSLTFLIGTFPSCQATLSMNGSTPIPAYATNSTTGDVPFSLYNLPLGTHSITWHFGAIPTGSEVIFWGVVGQRPMDGPTMTNVTIDDTYMKDGRVDLTYQGEWTHLASGMGSGLSEAAGLGNDFNKSLAVTQSQGAAVTFSGSGSAVYLYGTVGPDYGLASVNVNGKVVAPALNLTSPWAMPYELLWYQTGLDPTVSSNMTLTNLQNSKMALDFVILTADSSTISGLGTSSTSTSLLSTLLGKLIAFLIIPCCVLLFLSLGIFFFCVRRRDAKRRKATKRDSAVSLYNTRPKLTPRQHIEKRTSDWSAGSNAGEVFVSYDHALGQRTSDRWLAPSSPRYGSENTHSSDEGHASGSHRGGRDVSPRGGGRNHLPALPESSTTSPIETSMGTWTRPFQSLLGSRYTHSDGNSSIIGRERRGTNLTNLPPYTPGQHGTYDSTNTTQQSHHYPYPIAEQEKTAQHVIPPSHRSRPQSSSAPSEIISIFGAPPSERGSPTTTIAEPLSGPLVSVSPGTPQPKVNTDLGGRSGVDSPASSQMANSAVPLLRGGGGGPGRGKGDSNPFRERERVNENEEQGEEEEQQEDGWSDVGIGERSGGVAYGGERSLGSGSLMSEGSESGGGSLVRPDSDIIPFETFLSALKRGGA